MNVASIHRLAVVTVLGFASGLPLALTGTAMQAWLGTEGVDIATIGFLSLVGLPYTFKFLWAPLIDRFELPWLGRRRGWIVVTQLALAAALWTMAAMSPGRATLAFAAVALGVAFLSASQDVVIDAYRTNLLPAAERGLGSSSLVLGYRLAMIVSGGIAFIWVDPAQGGGWTWPQVYRAMAAAMAGGGTAFGARAAAARGRRAPGGPRPPRPDRLRRGGGGGRAWRAADAHRGPGDRRRRDRPAAAALVAGARAASQMARPRGAAAGHRGDAAARGLGRPPRALRDAARRPLELLRAASGGGVPRLRRALQAVRRVRAGAGDAVPAAGDALLDRRGWRRQQGLRPLADDRRGRSPAAR